MTRRHRGPYDVVPASALDAQERPRRSDVEVRAGGPPDGTAARPAIPDIAPPLLLEPIPLPTVLEPPTPAAADPEPLPHDPYALAAAAANQMEREGRAFDTADLLPHPHDVWHRGGHAPEPPTEEAPLVDDEPEAWTPPAPQRRPDQGLRLAVAALVFLSTTLLLVVSLFFLLWPAGAGNDILRPVPESVGSASSQRRFAVPPANLPSPPPGTAVGYDPRAATPDQRAAVRFESDPAGATVRVDGRVLGRTPLELSLPYGSYAAEFVLDGHAAVRRPVAIDAPNVTVSVPLERDQTWGRVDVIAPGWEGAVLYIDGEEHGRMPTSVVLQPGVHDFALRRDEDRLEVRRKIWVSRDAPVVVDLTQ